MELVTATEDPMVLESLLAERAREEQEAVLKKVVGMETSPLALTHSPVGDDMSKHGDGARSEAAQEERLALPTKPNEVGIGSEVPSEISTSPDSGNFNDNAGEGTAVAQKKRRNRGKNWAPKDTDDLLRAVSKTKKVGTRMEQGTASKSHWDAIAEAVAGRTGHECRGRMDTLNKSYTAINKYCVEHQKEFKQLSKKDLREMKVSPQFTEAWYNQIRDYCPPRPKKELETNGAGSSSKSTGFVPNSSTFSKANGLLCPCLSHVLDAMLINPSPHRSLSRSA